MDSPKVYFWLLLFIKSNGTNAFFVMYVWLI